MNIKSQFIMRKVGPEYLIIVPQSGAVDLTNVFHLNNTAAWLWEELRGREFSIDTVIDLLIARYDIEHSQALTDAFKFINLLTENGFLDDSTDA